MRLQKMLKNLAIIFLIACAIFLAIDIFKMLKINFDFMGMQSSERISSSSTNDAVRYEPTNYVITNKEDAIEEIKKITIALKDDYKSSGKVNLFEIGNIHKLEDYFYEYKSYAVVKYKLLNIIEDLPKLYSATKGYSNSELQTYFNNNISNIEKLYGITDTNDFIAFAKKIRFLGNGKVKTAIVDTGTINLDYIGDVLVFNMKLKADNGNIEQFFVRADYYKSNDNQVKPYLRFKVKN